MLLVQLIYVSSIAERLSEASINQIIESAKKNNAEKDITGLLCFNRKYFLQCLEGSRARVNEVYHKILNDKRHNKIILLDYKEISHRTFSSWSMGYVGDTTINAVTNKMYSISSEFDPYGISGESAYLLLKHLSENVGVV
ncbi:BLUF domain-containing protein [Vibrio sp. S4M6]|uniref:BLUF domain-containing protein n=1 Tax=Vibrio sinus TaxID=2946865 RepID=UPI00202A9F60|nr:BLUF domain-containing protein [Vibrio sinus]MCL9781958.1 BLUF domain-containing protein [Vibrio sinus]